MKIKIDNRIAVVLIIMVLVASFMWGRKQLKEPETAVGVNKDGSMMTKEQGEEMGRMMRGGGAPPAKKDDSASTESADKKTTENSNGTSNTSESKGN